MVGFVQDIPKLYTAIAEWLSCMIFVVLLQRRFSVPITAAISGGTLILLMVVQYLIGVIPVLFWLAGMAVALLMMYGVILLCCRITPADAGFYWAIAFISAEFSASLEWQVCSFFTQNVMDSVLIQAIFLLFFYGVSFWAMFSWQSKRVKQSAKLGVSKQEFSSAAVISVGAFLISNISYVNPNTPLSGVMINEVFYIRTLVDFAGVIMLYSLQDRWLEMQTRRELDSIQTLLQHQYEMYRQSRENIEIVNRKFHDLKHQIGVIRMEPDQKKREEYLKQVESGLKNAEADINTGNSVLDTILTGKQMYCKQNNIDMTVVADGTLLHFMEVMDICSIFGNALDNAIESVEKLSEPQKRLIRVAVYNQNNFLMIRVENYFESPLDMTNGEIQTTKKDKDYHGYGVKSIRYTAEQYGGSVSITAEDNWFYLRILIPISDNQK
jgi:hypothetical protein